MEDIARQKCSCNPISSPSSELAIHKDSHIISNKFKPKVRIIHIFAPEIIKTDVENFRELVQRLTGKPGNNLDNLGTGKGRSSGTKRNNRARNSPCCKKLMMLKKKKSASFSSSESNCKNMQYQDFGLSSLMEEEKLKMEDEENDIWGGSGESSSDFLDRFADFNGFMHDLSDNISITTLESSHMDVFGDMHFT